MFGENGSIQNPTGAGAATVNDPKGKGKAVAEAPAQDVSMDDDDDDEDDDESGDEPADAGEDEEDEDDLQEINTENVLGRRTRGKVIDFAKAAAENPAGPGDADDESDEDFNEDGGDEDTKMDED